MADATTREVSERVAWLLTEFCRRVDQTDGQDVADLFTEGARVVTPHFRLSGREQIHEWFAGRAGSKLSRHSWSNLRIDALGDGRFAVTSNMITAAGALPAPQQAGKIAFATATDEILFLGEAALFDSRTLEILFELGVFGPERAA